MDWSKKYYRSLDEWQHKANDEWFKKTLEMLGDEGKLFVPNLNKYFNNKGEEI